MALVHELLYRSNSIAHIKMQLYLGSLARDLVDSLSGSLPVELELQVEDLQLHINDAVPCGIIVNELITNAVTHGLAGRSSGRVEVALRQLDTQQYELRVSDDGEGLPGDFDPEGSASLGLRLVSLLALQLGGQLRVTSSPKTTFSVRFSPEG
jgi:two-component sensor histidine kinase